LQSLTLLSLLSFLAFTTTGQERVGGLVGVVTDGSGAAIPGATITVTAPSGAELQTVTTDANGNYRVQQVPAGIYVVSAHSQGFSTTRKTDILVELGRATRVEFQLEVGHISEQVVVSADAIQVDSQSSSSAVIVTKEFADLIPKGHSFYDLVAVAPGARPESKTGGVQVDGASGSENTFYLDGMEVTSIQTGELGSQNQIPIEMVEQTQIKNGVMDAQYGGAMGGVINAVLRSGSNELHGQVGFYFDNDALKARPRPVLRVNPFDDSVYQYVQTRQDSYSRWNPVFTLGHVCPN